MEALRVGTMLQNSPLLHKIRPEFRHPYDVTILRESVSPGVQGDRAPWL